jgi:hypothetical protein
MIDGFDDLERSLDRLNRLSLVGASSEVKADRLQRITRLRNKFDAVEAEVVGSFEVTGEHRAEGHGSSVDWVKHHARAKGTATVRARRLAGWLRDVPGLAGPLADGSISVDHVEVIARAHRLLGEPTYQGLEDAFVDAARTRRFGDFERTVEYWVVRADPELAKDKDKRQLADRNATSTRGPGGTVKVGAEFDRLSGVSWQVELDRLVAHLLAQDRAEAKARLGRPPTAAELQRTAGQRRLDAMRLMAERSAAFTGQELGASPVQLVVHADLNLVAKVLERIIDAIKADGDDIDLDGLTYDDDSLHELDDGTVITVNTILLALLTGTVRGILYDPEGVPLRLGRAQRLFGAAGDAISARFRRCGHPLGCDRTGRLVQHDHTVEWQDGGHTNADEAELRCGPHNIWKTNHRFDPPPDQPDVGQRRVGPEPGPPPHNQTERPAA